MTADDARAALAALDAAGACGAPTLRSALEALIKIDAAVRADLAAEHELDERHTEALTYRVPLAGSVAEGEGIGARATRMENYNREHTTERPRRGFRGRPVDARALGFSHDNG